MQQTQRGYIRGGAEARAEGERGPRRLGLRRPSAARRGTINLTRSESRATGLRPNAAANNTDDALYQLHWDANRSLVSRHWPCLFTANPEWITSAARRRERCRRDERSRANRLTINLYKLPAPCRHFQRSFFYFRRRSFKINPSEENVDHLGNDRLRSYLMVIESPLGKI